MSSDQRGRFLVAATFAAAAYLAFNFAVWGTNLANTPVRENACIGLWGEASCMSHPLVLIVTLIAAAIITSSVWAYLQAGLTRWAIVVLISLVVGSVFLTVVVKPHCRGGLRLAREINSPDGPTRWTCIGGIR